MNCAPEQHNQVNKLPPVNVAVDSGIFAARDAIKQLMRELKPLNLDIEEAGTFELVLAEVLNNVVEHGYPDTGSGGKIEIGCIHKSNGLHIQITDQGLPMPDGKTPLGLAAEVDVDLADMPEGGFGWFLIKDLAKDVEYERRGETNNLRLRLAVGIYSRPH